MKEEAYVYYFAKAVGSSLTKLETMNKVKSDFLIFADLRNKILILRFFVHTLRLFSYQLSIRNMSI